MGDPVKDEALVNTWSYMQSIGEADHVDLGEVQVLGIPFKFERVGMAYMDGNDGQVDFARGVIQVASHVPDGQVLEIFAHEYLEAANKVLDLQLDHSLICRLDVVVFNCIQEAKKKGLI